MSVSLEEGQAVIRLEKTGDSDTEDRGKGGWTACEGPQQLHHEGPIRGLR